MGLLDKLWDDTLAGPRPDTGLSRLRKHASFGFRSAAKEDLTVDVGNGRSYGAEDQRSPEVEEAPPPPRVTRSIMIKRPAGCPSPVNGTPPSSPAGSTPPVSPFSGGGAREWNRFRRKSASDAFERGGGSLPVTPRPPNEV